MTTRNPFKEDPIFQELLTSDLSQLASRVEFNGWRFSFLTKFDSFLDIGNSGCSDRAEEAYLEFSEAVANLVKVVHQMEQLIARGAISAKTTNVKGRQCLEEVKARSMAASDALAELLPGSGQHDDHLNKNKQRGYSNYHMGAILIGDGFSLYGYLSTCDTILQDRKAELLDDIIDDRQILAEIDNYHKKLQVFCDVMADLGLYDAMMKAREIAEKEGDSEDDLESILEAMSEHMSAMSPSISETESESDFEEETIVSEDFEEETVLSEEFEEETVLDEEFEEETVMEDAAEEMQEVAPELEPAPEPQPLAVAPIKPKAKKPKKKKKKVDTEPDPPMTEKPKAKMILPSMGRRGSMPARGGKQQSSPKAMVPKAKPRRATMPAAPASTAILALEAPPSPPALVETESGEEPCLALVPLPSSKVPVLDMIMIAAQKENIPGLSISSHHSRALVAKNKKPRKKKQPKSKPILPNGRRKAPSLPGNMEDRFRGSTGRRLSKAEAKEQPLPRITVKRNKAPAFKTPPQSTSKPKAKSPENSVERQRDAQPYGMDSSHGVDDPRVSLNREPQPYGMESSHGVNDPRVSLKREAQPYGMESNHGAEDPPVSWKRESQPYGMESTHGDTSDPPVSLKRESQPYGFVAQGQPEPEYESSDDDADEFYEDDDDEDMEEEAEEEAEEPSLAPVENGPPKISRAKRASAVFNALKKKVGKGAKVAAKEAGKGAKVAAKGAAKGAKIAAKKTSKGAAVAAQQASKAAAVATKEAKKAAAVAAKEAKKAAQIAKAKAQEARERHRVAREKAREEKEEKQRLAQEAAAREAEEKAIKEAAEKAEAEEKAKKEAAAKAQAEEKVKKEAARKAEAGTYISTVFHLFRRFVRQSNNLFFFSYNERGES